MKPTDEQCRALSLFGTGKELVIEAGAGTGKTSTLKMLAESTRRRGQYVAFNKSIVTEAGGKMPATVSCSTAHSLAYRAIVSRSKRIAERLRSSARMAPIQLARCLSVNDIDVEFAAPHKEVKAAAIVRKRLSPGFLAGLAMRGVGRFCQSADAEPNSRHVPFVDGIDAPDEYRNNRKVAETLVPAMRKAWIDLSSESGRLPFKHDHYLKIWHLSSPKINADYILFDECQDANPVLAAIVSAQNCQIVWVGDSQQAIYGFTGATNALKGIRENGGAVAFLSKSFRFGDAIAERANDILATIPDATLRLTGNESVSSRLDSLARPDCMLCRTNARAVSHFIDALDRRPHIVGGGTEIVTFANAVKELKSRGRTNYPELACFESWGEVQEYAANDEQGDDLRLMVSLIDSFGEDEILRVLAKMTPEKNAGLVISTAHKAKGREWDTVKIADDFRPPDEKTRVDELRLMYVAITRAKHVLDAEALEIRDKKEASVNA